MVDRIKTRFDAFLSREFHFRASGLAILIAVGAVTLFLWHPRIGETAQSYCRGIYENGGTTPSWAAFSDYRSCVEAYYAAQEDAGPSWR